MKNKKRLFVDSPSIYILCNIVQKPFFKIRNQNTGKEKRTKPTCDTINNVFLNNDVARIKNSFLLVCNCSFDLTYKDE